MLPTGGPKEIEPVRQSPASQWRPRWAAVSMLLISVCPCCWYQCFGVPFQITPYYIDIWYIQLYTSVRVVSCLKSAIQKEYEIAESSELYHFGADIAQISHGGWPLDHSWGRDWPRKGTIATWFSKAPDSRDKKSDHYSSTVKTINDAVGKLYHVWKR